MDRGRAVHDVHACMQMADLESAEKLLEELRTASYDRGVQELQVPPPPLTFCRNIARLS